VRGSSSLTDTNVDGRFSFTHTSINVGRVRLAGWMIAGWPATSQNHYSRPARTVFASHNNQPKQYFSVLPNRPVDGKLKVQNRDPRTYLLVHKNLKFIIFI